MRGETYYEKHEKVALVGASVAVAGSLVGCSWFGGNDEKVKDSAKSSHTQKKITNKPKR